jgi:hypothetical protein
MEKKQYTPMISLVFAIISLLGLLGCGIVCFNLNQALKIERQDASEARSQTSVLAQALKIQEHDVGETREQLATAIDKIADAQKQNQSLSKQMTEIQSKLDESRALAERHFAPVQLLGGAAFAAPAAVPDIAAADSIEGQLRSTGKHWERAEGKPLPGGFVEDLLPGRANRPKGGGVIGKVLFLSLNDDGRPCATVDFGRGYKGGIMLSELSPVRFIGPELR